MESFEYKEIEGTNGKEFIVRILSTGEVLRFVTKNGVSDLQSMFDEIFVQG